MKKIAIFASGAGSNAKRIIDHFKDSKLAKVELIVCNDKGAGVLQIASAENIEIVVTEKAEFNRTGYVRELKDRHIDFIALAGFLWKLPEILIKTFPGKIVNIHPALLPAYGGKGMYGAAVHKAVIGAKEKKSGITIHYVDEQYDHGNIIFHATCVVAFDDTPGSLAEKIHTLEHKYYPEQIEKILRDDF